MMAAPWIALSLNRFHHSVPFFVMGGISIASSILLLNVDETNGKGLTEILKKDSVASVDKLEENSVANADKLEENSVANADKQEERSVANADKLQKYSVVGVDNKSFDAIQESRYKDFKV